MNELKFYVYGYLDPSKPCKLSNNDLDFSFLYEPFYIGKGNGDRLVTHLKKSKLNKKTHLSNKINKIKSHGLKPIIVKLYEDLSEDKSLEIEKKLINLIGKRLSKTGPLVNITDGGEGVSGLKHTEESKKKMSNKGDKHPNWNKHLSEETREKISIRLKLNNPMSNPEVAEKVRLKNLGRTPWNKGTNTPKDVCKKLSEKKIKYFNIELISKKDNSSMRFNSIYEVVDYLGKCYRSVYLYLKKGESKDFYIKFEEKS